ncbi:unnamed protein product [Paramecium sonneborni]|uniref:Uncharacterized protein n=1 Tax=Paramecium sonneborni TaxID=65129 RepID=A0A8S1QRH1_9CILI|nr:unnamed protein product [Paramecium sonneborni]
MRMKIKLISIFKQYKRNLQNLKLIMKHHQRRLKQKWNHIKHQQYVYICNRMYSKFQQFNHHYQMLRSYQLVRIIHTISYQNDLIDHILMQYLPYSTIQQHNLYFQMLILMNQEKNKQMIHNQDDHLIFNVIQLLKHSIIQQFNLNLLREYQR